MSYEYIEDSTGKYLKKIDLPDSVEERIMLYQEIPGLLSFDIRRVNGKKETLYDVTGRISLLQYLKEEAISLEKIQNLFLQIFEIEETLKAYLLDSSALVIQGEYLFLEKKTGKLYGIYNEELSCKNMEAYRRLLENIMDFMDGTDVKVASLVYELHKATTESDCTRKRLRELLEEKVKKTENFLGDKVQRKQNKWDGYGEKKMKLMLPQKESNMTYLTSAVIAGIGIFLFLFLWQGGYFNNPVHGGMDSGKMWGAIIFFGIVIGYGVWKTLPERKENFVVYGEEENRKKVCLISKWGKQEPIEVFSFPYRMGKDGERVQQVINAPEISPIHARLEKEGLEFYVIDEESVQGTFKNGERLVPYCKTILRDGDILQLGKEEYVVEIT